MKNLMTNKKGAINYATIKIHKALGEKKKMLSQEVAPGRIGLCFFDRQWFDKQLSKKIRKKYNCKVNLDRLYGDAEQLLGIYIQQDFLQNPYNHSFKKYGKYKDYGMVIFYANGDVDNLESFTNFLERWFYEVVLPQYNNEKACYDTTSDVSEEPFRYVERWKNIYEVCNHFCPNYAENQAEYWISRFANKAGVKIKKIDKFKIVFA